MKKRVCAYLKNKFNFIGIELEDKYIKIAKSRMECYSKIMVKIKEDQTNRYIRFFCKICKSPLFRTIESKKSLYYSPSIICDCKECNTKHLIKYNFEKIEFDIIDIAKKSKNFKIELP